MNEKCKFVRSDNFVERNLGGEKVLIPINQFGVEVQSIYTLNDTAAAVWSLLASEKTCEDLVMALELQYLADRDVMRKDVEELLRELVDGAFAHEVTE